MYNFPEALFQIIFYRHFILSTNIARNIHDVKDMYVVLIKYTFI